MCKALSCLAIAVGLAIWCFCAVGVANADPYKWCAQYGGEDGGGTNCGFGMGGFCVPNPFYTGPDKTPAKHSRKRSGLI
jgi:hypothetical protein